MGCWDGRDSPHARRSAVMKPVMEKREGPVSFLLMMINGKLFVRGGEGKGPRNVDLPSIRTGREVFRELRETQCLYLAPRRSTMFQTAISVRSVNVCLSRN